jgi:hypothetical protein
LLFGYSGQIFPQENTVASIASDSNTYRSSYREAVIEHLFIGELMRLLWLKGIADFEVLQPEVDDSGYDLVVEANGCTRHIQLKSSFQGASTKQVKASIKLATKPSACIIWILFDRDTMALGPFLWFGAAPRKPLPSIAQFPLAKHTRANASGVKKARPNQRAIPRSQFTEIPDFESLLARLFGAFVPHPRRLTRG